jgi:hypothetical protein
MEMINDQELLDLLDKLDPDCVHSDLSNDNDTYVADLWREADRRGLLNM